jgi:hypothetical protein
VAWLWASAFVLAALLTLQVSRLGDSRPAPAFIPIARADLVSRVADQTMLTFNAGNDDVLVVLDSRGEQLLTYRVRNQTSLELISVYSIPELFATGQRIGVGRTGGSGGGGGTTR